MKHLFLSSSSVLQGLDWVVLSIYFLALVAVAVWVVLQKNKNTEDYFLAGRNVGWFVIGASIFASNIGSEHVVGLAGTGFESGTPMAHYELHAWIVLLLGWLFLPFYIRSGGSTTPELLEKRFDSRSRRFLSIFSLVVYVSTKFFGLEPSFLQVILQIDLLNRYPQMLKVDLNYSLNFLALSLTMGNFLILILIMGLFRLT